MSKGQWQRGKITGDQEILSRDKTLRILSEQALNGSVTAAVALERALRARPRVEEDVDDVLARILSE
jgi:hypothetical protein